jgi:hypothetical protein
MTNPTESRYITHPTVLEKSPTSYTIVLVDPYELEIKVLTSFLKQCPLNFDVYFYTGETDDLQYLNEITKTADAILINDASEVKVTPDGKRYGPDLDLTSCIDYFRRVAAQNV